jgi:type I restriction enzyme S subunit
VRVVPLSEAVAVNPKIDRTQLADVTEVSFVPMAAVGAADGSIDASTVRPYAEVKKGYTHFRENDVLFAKVTPCMENGKMAVARHLKNGMGFGSTEFHVLRPREGVDPHYVYHFVSSQTFRKEAARHMTGAVGLRRVPSAFLESAEIPLPALEVQREIVAELEKQFSRLDEAVANLQRVKANLKRYKASVLKAAVEGRLVDTEATLARREGRTYETGEQLLQRILAERRANWTGRGKYKEPESPRIEHTFDLPEGWAWATLGHLSLSVKDGPHYSPKYAEEGIPFISGGNVRPEGIDFTSTKYITKELHQELSKRCKPEVGDLLYTKGGTTGIARVNTDPREFNVWVHVAVLKLAEPLDRLYVQHALNSQHCYRQSQEYTHGVGNQDLGLTRMVWITVPLPPQAEQIRIVAEVDRHLSIVREVEAEVDANLQRAQSLRQSVLQRSFSTASPKAAALQLTC